MNVGARCSGYYLSLAKLDVVDIKLAGNGTVQCPDTLSLDL